MQGLLKGRYHIHQKIGQGGMGAVYEATDTRLQRPVAIKVLPSLNDSDRIHRFMLEAQAVAQLNHPNIVTIHDYDEDQGQPFIVMELVPGQNISRHRLHDLSSVLRAIIQVTDALAYAHLQGVIHRDLKPDNIRITPDSQIRIMDFGLATFTGRPQLTNTGMLVGTFAYMAPEQAIGGAVDERTDIYAVGLIIYELLTGQLPFRGDNSLVLLNDRLHRIPLPVRKLRPDIPPRLEATVQKALAKLPDQRFQNAGELHDALAEIHATLPAEKRHVVPTLEVPKPSELNPEHPTEELPLSALDAVALDAPSSPQSLLSGDPHQTALPGTSHAPAPTHYSALKTPFIGRHTELESLQRLLDGISTAQGSCVMIGGDPGSGRSTLMDAFVRMAEPYILIVWRNRCMADLSTPLQPFVQILRNDLRNRPAGAQLSATHTPPEDLNLLSALIPDLNTFNPSIEPPIPDDRSRPDTLAALVNFIERRAQETALLIILEELNEADPDTVLAVRQLIASARTNPIGLVITYNQRALSRSHPLHAMLFGADRESSPVHHILERFSLEETTELVSHFFPHGPPELATAIHGATDGLPLFVHATLRALGTTSPEQSGDFDGEHQPETLPIPDVVSEATERSFTRLSKAAQSTLCQAAIIGHAFEFDLLESLSEDSEDTLIDALDEALAHQLIHAPDEERYHFDSVFVWRIIYDKTHPRRRARYHDRLGELLEERNPTPSLPDILDITHHFTHGATRKDPSRAITYLLRAADLQSEINPEKALQLLEQAASLIERSEAPLPELAQQTRERISILRQSHSG